jgi:hypothetical protein
MFEELWDQLLHPPVDVGPVAVAPGRATGTSFGR